jgi:hypothetical protein
MPTLKLVSVGRLIRKFKEAELTEEEREKKNANKAAATAKRQQGKNVVAIRDTINGEPAPDVVIKAIKDAKLPEADLAEIARGIVNDTAPDLKATLATARVDDIVDALNGWDVDDLKELARRIAGMVDAREKAA